MSDVKTISDDEIHAMLIIIAMGEGELIPVSRVERLVKEFRNLRIENAELSGKIRQLESQMVHIYNSGYHAGHNDTVEGCYTDIVSADMDTYHTDVVRDLCSELLAEGGE